MAQHSIKMAQNILEIAQHAIKMAWNMLEMAK